MTLRTPGGREELEILAVRYVPLATGAAGAARPRARLTPRARAANIDPAARWTADRTPISPS